MYHKKETKEALLEIIDATISLIDGSNTTVCKKAVKKSLHRLYVIVKGQLEDYTIRLGFAPRMRKRHLSKYKDLPTPLIAAIRYGFMCSYDPFFIKNINFKNRDAIFNYFFKVKIKGSNMNFIVPLKEALDKFPIDDCDDFHHLVQSFEMMRDWVHAYGPFLIKTWGLRMAINDARFAFITNIFDGLASKELQSVENVKRLRRKVEMW